MGLLIKTKNLKGLEAMGATSHQVVVLTEWGAEWVKGPNLMINIAHGVKLYVYKSTTYNPGHEAVKSFLMEVIHQHVAATEGPSDIPFSEEVKSFLPDNAKKPLVDLSQPVDKVIPLRMAQAMYQRVIGTSNNSVYVVVAISSKSDVKVAAKVAGMSLSVRVEGGGLDKAVTLNKLSEQGLTLKSKPEFTYMSGHYSCDTEAPPQKVLGAILMGSGIHFDTVMPLIGKVMEGGA